MLLTGGLADYEGVQKRVEILIGIFAALGLATAAWRWGARAAMGFGAGSAIAWINYRWLRRGVRAILPGAPRAPEVHDGGETGASAAPFRAPKAPFSVFARFAGRYLLLGAGLYVILAYSLVPAGAFLAGLFVAAAAVLAEYSFAWKAHNA
jgi:small-conductance mechanosensitive channel